MNGRMINDGFCINNDTSHCLKGFDFMAITSLFPPFLPASGIIGLAPFSGHSSISIVEAFKNEGMIDSDIFGLYLQRNMSDPNDKSEIRFGGYDTTKMIEDKDSFYIHWMPITTNQDWQIDISNAYHGSASFFSG